MLSASVVVAGLVVGLTLQGLLGPLLVIGGVSGLGVAMLPATFARIGVFLSTGSLRNKSRR
jgi:hypothetical protein